MTGSWTTTSISSLEPSPSPISSVCSSQWSPGSSKENFDPIEMPTTTTTTTTKSEEPSSKKLTVIAKHRRLGEESLSRLKDEVRRYAVEHTFKETAKKFGIHHSTVSGWVKARERAVQGNLSLRNKPSKCTNRPRTMFL
jgi:hypothetical protein